MEGQTSEVYESLCHAIDELIKVYRNLLNVVRKEKEILVSAQLDDLNENNRAKEAMLIKIMSLDENRLKLAQQLAELEGIDSKPPRLLDFAVHFDGEKGERLRNYHSVLELLLKRVQDFNRENEVLVQSALSNITGAMEAIRTTLLDKPTYAKKGKVEQRPAAAGQLVSREA